MTVKPGCIGPYHVSGISLQKGEKSLLQRRKTALLGWI
jgi:hypothetical protein